MAGDDQEKTEEPTPKKIEDAKKEGNIAKSAEIVGTLVLTVGTMYLLFFSTMTVNTIKVIMQNSYNQIPYGIDGIASLMAFTSQVLKEFIYTISPLLVIAVVFALVGNWSQFGLIFVPLKLKFDKLDPINGFSNVFSMKKIVEAFKLLMKLFVVLGSIASIFYNYHKDIIRLGLVTLDAAIPIIVKLLIVFLGVILLIIFIFAIIDYYFVKYNHTKSLRMSKQEIKDEFKNMDGDPQVKARIRQIQHQASQRRSLQSVADADVVVTNPTHYAVALKYDKEVSAAPIMIAKGVDVLALKIREIATDNDVPIVENPPLARALYAQMEVDQSIPEAFYQTVAEVFVYVYSLKKK
jgi:flagellar biosynthetic protein FlhB